MVESVETGGGWMQKISPLQKERRGGRKGAAGVGTIQPFKERTLKFFNSNITTGDTSFPFILRSLSWEDIIIVYFCAREWGH